MVTPVQSVQSNAATEHIHLQTKHCDLLLMRSPTLPATSFKKTSDLTSGWAGKNNVAGGLRDLLFPASTLLP